MIKGACADHKKQEVTIFSLDRAVQLLEEAMDWPKIQKLVLTKTVPQKAGGDVDHEDAEDETKVAEMDNPVEKTVSPKMSILGPVCNM